MRNESRREARLLDSLLPIFEVSTAVLIYRGSGETHACYSTRLEGGAELAGIPVALLGQAAYATLFALALLALLASEDVARRCAACILTLVGLSAVFSGYLLYVSAVRIKAHCSLCLALDMIILAALLVSFTLSRNGVIALLRDTGRFIVTFPPRGEAWCALVLLAGTTVLLDRQYQSAGRRLVEATLANFEGSYTKIPIEDVGDVRGRPAAGPANAPVTIVVFSDFQCPHCRRVGKALREVQRAFPGRTQVVFRHFPICAECNPYTKSMLHRRACLLARAAEAAHEQGRFWEMHDRLFELGGAIGEEPIVALARELSLDVDRFRARLASPAELDARIVEDARVASSLKIRGTPLVFVNGRRFAWLTSDALRKAIVFELFRAEAQ